MDKDRVAGAAKQVKGAVKQAVGMAIGDAKLEFEGQADKVEGKVQNAIGGVKERLKTHSKENRHCEWGASSSHKLCDPVHRRDGKGHSSEGDSDGF